MNRSLFSGRYLVITVVVIVLLSRLLGAWGWQKRDHGCIGDDGFRLGAKVQMFQWGSLRLYAWPVSHDCPQIEQFRDQPGQTVVPSSN